MSAQNGDDNGRRSGLMHRKSRQRMAVAGVAGLAVIGAGAYAIGAHDGGSGMTREVGAPAPVVPSTEDSATQPASPDAVASSVAASPSAAGAVSTQAKQPKSEDPSGTSSPDAAVVRDQIKKARERAAADGVPLKRPPRDKGTAVAASLISTRTEQIAGQTIRLTSAPADLTGQQDHALAADKGTPAGRARCTQRFQFTNSSPAREIPTMLLCWRISSERSVLTVAVVEKGRPSAATSIAIIDREWAKLG